MWKYLGTGDYVGGIPARDISDEEAAELELTDVLAAYPTLYKHIDKASRSSTRPTPPVADTPARREA